MLDDSGSDIVSPFLQEIEDGWLQNSEAVEIPAVREAVKNGHRLVVDTLCRSVIAVPAYIFQSLVDMRSGGVHMGSDSLSIAACQRARHLGLLLPADCETWPHSLRHLEIEINRHCNYRCVFCPVSQRPHPRAFMGKDLFEKVLRRAVEYGIESVSLNHYSEPTLHPQLGTFAEMAAKVGLGVTVFTNASALTPSVVKALLRATGTDIVVNMPAIDAAIYTEVTGGGRWASVFANVGHAVESGLPVTVSMNCPNDEAQRVIASATELFRPLGIRCSHWPTDDRAGLMTISGYCSSQQHGGYLNGCSLFLGELNVAWDGTAFLCAQDYDEEYDFGNIVDMSLEQIVQSPRYQQMRRWVFGIKEAPEKFICRRCAWTSEQAPGELSVGRQDRSIDKEYYLSLLAKAAVAVF